jgi:hypothetical protein
MNHSKLEVTMMKLFDFETIAVNQRGEKTKKQIKDMKFGTNPMIWGGTGLILFGFFAFLASAVKPDLWQSAWWILPVLEFIPLIRGFAFWKSRRRLLNDKVVSATGTIAYGSSVGGYSSKTDDGRTASSLLVPQNLPPGKYRFYHLEKEDWWLSAEPLSSEAEMRSNLNDALASTFGYNREHLEYCRRRAGAAALKTAEGLLKIHRTSEENGPGTPESFTVGEVTFDIARKDGSALIENIPYRVYYREEEKEETLLKQFADLIKSRKMDFEAIEAV